ncbi:hypothetical protein J6590_098406 [Homalodisca vitripennis]|nr:hypothetical protein J6590_098406 [Homalodisca vitripennis]
MLGRSTSNVVMSWAPQRVGPVDVVSGGGTCAWPIPFLFYLPWGERWNELEARFPISSSPLLLPAVMTSCHDKQQIYGLARTGL